VILDTNGNIFGGFTPVLWESGDFYKADSSLASFLFTLKNPHDFPERRFALNGEKKGKAIRCVSLYGPYFHDISVSDKCNENTDSFAYFDNTDDSYNNDTGMDGDTFFTGSRYFQVKEIEVFEIMN
jgi:hypothetical protein